MVRAIEAVKDGKIGVNHAAHDFERQTLWESGAWEKIRAYPILKFKRRRISYFSQRGFKNRVWKDQKRGVTNCTEDIGAERKQA